MNPRDLEEHVHALERFGGRMPVGEEPYKIKPPSNRWKILMGEKTNRLRDDEEGTRGNVSGFIRIKGAKQ